MVISYTTIVPVFNIHFKTAPGRKRAKATYEYSFYSFLGDLTDYLVGRRQERQLNWFHLPIFTSSFFFLISTFFGPPLRRFFLLPIFFGSFSWFPNRSSLSCCFSPCIDRGFFSSKSKIFKFQFYLHLEDPHENHWATADVDFHSKYNNLIIMRFFILF